MTRSRLRRPLLLLATALILVGLSRPSGAAVPTSANLGTGYRALQPITAEGGIVLPKGTEFRLYHDPLDNGGGTITLTLLVDDAETLKAKFVAIENPTLMYHVAK